MPEIPEKHKFCPLCGSSEVLTCGTTDRGAPYFQCQACSLIGKFETAFPTPTQERDRYLTHNNHTADQGYTEFLLGLWRPTKAFWQQGRSKAPTVLDYGCGPTHAMANALQNISPVSSYDPYFTADTAVLKKTWDIILCSEVWEHFRNPSAEINKLRKLLAPNGVIAVRTGWHQGPEHFKNWWYQHDTTHLHFFSTATLSRVAEVFALDWCLAEKNIAIFSDPNRL